MLKVGDIITLKKPLDGFKGVGADFIVTDIKDGYIFFAEPSCPKYSGTVAEKLLNEYFYWFDVNDFDMGDVHAEVETYINNCHYDEAIIDDNCLAQTMRLPWGFTISKSYVSPESLTAGRIDPNSDEYEGEDEDGPYWGALNILIAKFGKDLERYEEYHQRKSAYEKYLQKIDAETPRCPGAYR